MSTNLNRRNRSWFKIMWQNGYIQVLAVFLFFALTLIVKRHELQGEAPLGSILAWLIILGGIALIIIKGFIQFWTYLNSSKGWRVWTITEGRQRSSIFRTPWFFKTSFIRNWKLDKSCHYQVGHQHWINKIWGIGFGILPKKIDGRWVPAHHVNSIRFGWEPHPIQSDCYTLMIYIYDNGVRICDEIGVVKYGDEIMLDIKINGPRSVSLHAHNDYINRDYTHFFKNRLSTFGYRLGFTFGGYPNAPHNMQAWEQKA